MLQLLLVKILLIVYKVNVNLIEKLDGTGNIDLTEINNLNKFLLVYTLSNISGYLPAAHGIHQ